MRLPEPQSQRPPRPRRGAARALALLLLALGVACAALWLALRSEGADPGGAPAGVRASADARPAQKGAAPAEDGAPESPAAAAVLPGAAPRAGLAAEGVRLSGDGRLEGVVVEREGGAPVPGATVELLTLPPVGQRFLGRFLRLSGMGEELARRGHPAAVTRTDPLGRFSFRGVRRGTYHLDARGPFHAMDGTASARVLASGEGGPVELFVRPAGGIDGRVLLPDGSPAPRARVVLEPGPGSFLDSARSGWLRLFETRAGEDGRFGVEGLPPAEHYEVSAWLPGHAIAHATDVRVAAGARAEVVVVLRAGGDVEGRVLARPLGEEGEPRPLAGAHVSAVPRGLRHLRMTEEVLLASHARTDEAGRYRMRSLPEGDVDVLVFAPGHLPARVGPIAVLEGSPAQAEDVVLAGGPTVAGRVVDTEGRPVSGVLVRWDLVDWRRLELDFTFAPLLHQAAPGFAYPTTDAEGRFRAGPFAGRAPHRMDFVKSGFATRSRSWDPTGDEAELEIEVVLSRGGAIEGVVMDLERAEPLPSFTVFAPGRVELSLEAPGRFNSFSGGEVFESPEGRFRLEPVRAGAAELVVSAPGFVSTTIEGVEVREGETTRGLIVRMRRGGLVRGEVVDPAGRPVAGARVLALHEGGGRFRTDARGRAERRQAMRSGGIPPLPPALLDYAVNLGFLDDRSTRSDAAGQFELTGIEPGRLRVVALHAEWCAGASELAELEREAPLEGVRVALTAGGGLTGNVLDRNGRGLEGALVIAAAPGRFAGDAGTPAGGLYSGRSGVGGAYRIERMVPGSYVVLLARGDDALDIATVLGRLDLGVVTVPPGEPVRHDVVDEGAGGCRVYGLVSDAGAPLTRGRVTAVHLEADSVLGVGFKVARIAADGSYEFEGLAPGEHLFRVEGAGVPVRLAAEVLDILEQRIDLASPEGAVLGRVVEEATGLEVEGARVALRSLERPPAAGLLGAVISGEAHVLRARTGEGGGFALRRVPAGRHELLVEPPPDARGRLGAAEPRRIELREGQRLADLSVRLPSALALEGRVVDSAGRPVEGARVRALREDGADLSPRGARSDAGGGFTIAGLAAGPHLVVAAAEGYAEGRLEGAEVGPGAEPVELVLPRGILVVLEVRGPGGSPLAGARGRLSRAEPGPEAALEAGQAARALFAAGTATGADGRVELGRFAPGAYALDAWRGLSRTHVPGIELAGDDTTQTLTVTLP